MNAEKVKENVLLVLIQHPTPLWQQFSSSSVVKFLHNITNLSRILECLLCKKQS
jgi:hypothetical protein